MSGLSIARRCYSSASWFAWFARDATNLSRWGISSASSPAAAAAMRS